MMQASTPARIPEGLAGAIALLKQNANPVAPGPGGAPIKSVVGAMMDNAERAGGIASLGSPPMGDAMPEGTMYGAAENLRNAMPTMERNAQEDQLNQVAQRVRQMDAAETGIAPMAGPMGMAEGGIIGYSGEFGSQVDGEAAAMDAVRVAERAKQRKVAELTQQVEFLEAAGAPQATAKRRELEALLGPTPAAPAAPRTPGDVAAAREAMPSQAVPTRAPAPARAAAPADTGIGALRAPTSADVLKIVRELGLDKEEPRVLPGAMRQMEELMSKRPTSSGIQAAIKRAGQERNEAAPTDRLRALFRGWAEQGLGGPQVAQFDEALRMADLADAKAIDTAKRADYALAMGDMKAYADLAAKADEYASKAKQIKTLTMNAAMDHVSKIYQVDTSRMNAQERAAAQLENTMLRLAMGQKPPAQMSPADRLKVDETLRTRYPVDRMTPDLKEFIAASVPNSAQLLMDIEKGRLKPGSAAWTAAMSPIAKAAREAELARLMSGVRGGEATMQPRSFTEFFPKQ